MQLDVQPTRRQARLLVAGIVLALLAIGALDFVTGIAPDLTIFYLLPLLGATYFLGRRAGLLAALGAVATQTTALLLSDVAPVRDVIDGSLHALVFALVVLGADRILTELRNVQRLEALRDLDLEAARAAHADVIGDIATKRDDIDVSSHLQFMREIGGDYTWFGDLGPDRSLLCVADISGKGVVAALFTALLDQSVRAAVRTPDVARIVRTVNRRICDVVPTNMFVTMFAAALTGRSLAWFNAGHEPALLWRRRTGRVETLETDGTLPLGVSDRLGGEAASVDLDDGDVLLVVTDGVTESHRFRSEGREALVAVLCDAAAAGHSAEAIVEAVRREALADGHEPTDDIAIVCVRYRGAAAA